MNPHAINIFTDGSSIPNPGKSGQGIVIMFPDDTQKEISSLGYKKSNNQRSELRAFLEALKYLRDDDRARLSNHVCIYSDSEYLVKNYKNALNGNWQKYHWKTKDGHDIDNQDIWKDIIRESKKISKRIEFYWVKGHAKTVGNKIADRLADESSKTMAVKIDYAMKKISLRKYLEIPILKVGAIDVKTTFIVYVQRIDPRKKQFDAHVQIIRPKKYLGVREKIRGILGKDDLHLGHFISLKLNKDCNNLIIKELLEDMGRPNDNKELWSNKK